MDNLTFEMLNKTTGHELSEIDEANNTALCASCGRILVHRQGRNPSGKPRWRCSVAMKIYKEANKDRLKAQTQTEEYRERRKQLRRKPENQTQTREYNRQYDKTRKDSDLNYRLRINLRVRLYEALKGQWKTGSAVRDLGCSIEELKQYIAAQFQEGMSWGNWGANTWHIDHIVPLSSFDLRKREELLEAVHYTNLQPLWATDNIRKGSRI